MKRLVEASLVLAMAACGSGGGGGGGAAGTSSATSVTTSTATSSAVATSAEQSNETAPAYHSMLVADAAALPACTAEAEGWLVYVTAESAFKACAAGTWAAVDIKGEKGDAGAAGKDGKDGAAGKDGKEGEEGAPGTDNRIVSSAFCSFDLDNSTVESAANGAEAVDLAARPIRFDIVTIRYTAVEFASGDVLVTLRVGDGRDDSSSTAFYSVASSGAKSGYITVTRDYAFEYDGGVFEVTGTNGGLIVEYTDVAPAASYNNFGSGHVTVSWAIPSSVCSVTDY